MAMAVFIAPFFTTEILAACVAAVPYLPIFMSVKRYMDQTAEFDFPTTSRREWGDEGHVFLVRSVMRRIFQLVFLRKGKENKYQDDAAEAAFVMTDELPGAAVGTADQLIMTDMCSAAEAWERAVSSSSSAGDSKALLEETPELHPGHILSALDTRSTGDKNSSEAEAALEGDTNASTDEVRETLRELEHATDRVGGLAVESEDDMEELGALPEELQHQEEASSKELADSSEAEAALEGDTNASTDEVRETLRELEHATDKVGGLAVESEDDMEELGALPEELQHQEEVSRKVSFTSSVDASEAEAALEGDTNASTDEVKETLRELEHATDRVGGLAVESEDDMEELGALPEELQHQEEASSKELADLAGTRQADRELQTPREESEARVHGADSEAQQPNQEEVADAAARIVSKAEGALPPVEEPLEARMVAPSTGVEATDVATQRQVADAELQAMKAELQAAKAELQAMRAELQAVRAELQTVRQGRRGSELERAASGTELQDQAYDAHGIELWRESLGGVSQDPGAGEPVPISEVSRVTSAAVVDSPSETEMESFDRFSEGNPASGGEEGDATASLSGAAGSGSTAILLSVLAVLASLQGVAAALFARRREAGLELALAASTGFLACAHEELGAESEELREARDDAGRGRRCIAELERVLASSAWFLTFGHGRLCAVSEELANSRDAAARAEEQHQEEAAAAGTDARRSERKLRDTLSLYSSRLTRAHHQLQAKSEESKRKDEQAARTLALRTREKADVESRLRELRVRDMKHAGNLHTAVDKASGLEAELAKVKEQLAASQAEVSRKEAERADFGAREKNLLALLEKSKARVAEVEAQLADKVAETREAAAREALARADEEGSAWGGDQDVSTKVGVGGGSGGGRRAAGGGGGGGRGGPGGRSDASGSAPRSIAAQPGLANGEGRLRVVNAVLQILRHVPALRDGLCGPCEGASPPIVNSLRGIFQHGESLSASSFEEKLAKSLVDTGDARKVLEALLVGLDKDVKHGAWWSRKKELKSALSGMQVMVELSGVCCRCGQGGVRGRTISRVLAVPVTQTRRDAGGTRISLPKMMEKNFFHEAPDDSTRDCPNCHAAQWKKRWGLSRNTTSLPSTFFIALERAEGCSATVEIPVELNVAPMITSNSRGTAIWYDLKGVVIHQGAQQCKTFILAEGNVWACFDNEQVTKEVQASDFNAVKGRALMMYAKR
eukprot:g9988.t2